MAAVALFVLLAEVYFGLGLLFAIVFVWRGAGAIDPAARDGTLGFRLLIVPASALLWPALLRRWLRHAPPPLERNAHRDAAGTVAVEPSPESERAPSRRGGTP